MTSKKGQADDALTWLDADDPFGLEEEIDLLSFQCLNCGKTDEVPDFVVDEFSYDLKRGEVVEVECPFCNGTMRQASDNPK